MDNSVLDQRINDNSMEESVPELQMNEKQHG